MFLCEHSRAGFFISSVRPLPFLPLVDVLRLHSALDVRLHAIHQQA